MLLLAWSNVADGDETVYALTDWPSSQVGALVSALRDRQITFVLEGSELVVPNEYESEVDRLVAAIDGSMPRDVTPVPPPPETHPGRAGGAEFPAGAHGYFPERTGFLSRLRHPLKDETRPWVIAAGAAVAVGSLMPWVSVTTGFGSVSVSGTEGDGVFTLGAGIVAAVLGALRKRLAVLIVLAIAAAVAAYHVVNVSQRAQEVTTDFARASVGWGLWLVLAGSISGLVLAWTGGRTSPDVSSALTLPPPPAASER
jgi:hypothetical protein